MGDGLPTKINVQLQPQMAAKLCALIFFDRGKYITVTISTENYSSLSHQKGRGLQTFAPKMRLAAGLRRPDPLGERMNSPDRDGGLLLRGTGGEER